MLGVGPRPSSPGMSSHATPHSSAISQNPLDLIELAAGNSFPEGGDDFSEYDHQEPLLFSVQDADTAKLITELGATLVAPEADVANPATAVSMSTCHVPREMHRLQAISEQLRKQEQQLRAMFKMHLNQIMTVVQATTTSRADAGTNEQSRLWADSSRDVVVTPDVAAPPKLPEPSKIQEPNDNTSNSQRQYSPDEPDSRQSSRPTAILPEPEVDTERSISKSFSERFQRKLSSFGLPVRSNFKLTKIQSEAFAYFRKVPARELSIAEQLKELKKARDKRANDKSRKPADEHNTIIAFARRLIEARQFEVVCSGIIVLNAIAMGAEATYGMENLFDLGAKVPTIYEVLRYIFTVLFTLELSVRLIAEHKAFLSMKNQNVKWNIFDLLLVVFGLMDLIAFDFLENLFVASETNDSSAGQMSAVRMLRILRLVRIMRLLRVMRFFRDLEVMVSGIVSSLKQLFWALLLLFLIMYTCAVCLMQAITDELSNGSIPLDSPVRQDAVKYFGGLITSIYTLYMTICGGIDWGDVSDPLITINPLYGFLFTLYVAFAIFCVLNIVTGVFVESSNRMLARDEDMQFLEDLEARERWVSNVRHVFEKCDPNNTRTMTLENFLHYVTNCSGQLEMNRLGLELDVSSAMDFFGLLDHDCSGCVSIDEFLAGVRQIKGTARGLDVARVRQDTFHLKATLDEVIKALKALGQMQKVEHRNHRDNASHSQQKHMHTRPQSSTLPAVTEGDVDGFTLPGAL